MMEKMFIVDGHVHIYPGYDLDAFFLNVLKNMDECLYTRFPGEEECRRVLLLTEGKDNNFFSQFKNAGTGSPSGKFVFENTDEESSLLIKKDGTPLCHLFSGRQIVTKEKLEVLSIATNKKIPDGLPIDEVVKQLISEEIIAVLAWGVGKWFFGRGKIIERVLRTFRSPYLFIGDNSSRPMFWGTPALYAMAESMGVRVLNGSDPLPFKDEVRKVGTYGFFLKGAVDDKTPARSFCHALLAGENPLETAGRRDDLLSFLSRQLKMFLKKYIAKA